MALILSKYVVIGMQPWMLTVGSSDCGDVGCTSGEGPEVVTVLSCWVSPKEGSWTRVEELDDSPSFRFFQEFLILTFVLHTNESGKLRSFENSYIPENPRTPPIFYISQTVIPFKKTDFGTLQNSFFRKLFFATGLVFERFLALRSRFFEKVNGLRMLVQVRTIIKFENGGTNLERYKSHKPSTQSFHPISTPGYSSEINNYQFHTLHICAHLLGHPQSFDPNAFNRFHRPPASPPAIPKSQIDTAVFDFNPLIIPSHPEQSFRRLIKEVLCSANKRSHPLEWHQDLKTPQLDTTASILVMVAKKGSCIDRWSRNKIIYNTKRVCYQYDINDWLRMCYTVTHFFSVMFDHLPMERIKYNSRRVCHQLILVQKSENSPVFVTILYHQNRYSFQKTEFISVFTPTPKVIFSKKLTVCEFSGSRCWDLLRTHIFPRTRELPQFSISPKPLFIYKNRLRDPPKRSESL
ncbi:hypothetical protein LXL04_023737 [Taraxacum kok-saghyz]